MKTLLISFLLALALTLPAIWAHIRLDTLTRRVERLEEKP